MREDARSDEEGEPSVGAANGSGVGEDEDGGEVREGGEVGATAAGEKS